MKGVKFTGILTLVSYLVVCGQPTENTVQIHQGWKSLKEQRYSINYPDQWELDQSGQMGTSFILFSPLNAEQDQFKENVNLLIQDLTGHNLDLDKYVEVSESQIETMLPDGKIIESKRIATDSYPYQKVIYTGTQGTFKLKFEQYYWVINDNAFVLTLTCEENQFESYRATGEKILNSFRLK